MHERQHYELVHHSRGNRELNYRRFFAVTTLAGIRVEDPAVFDATHALVRSWVDVGIAGLRIDHPDGLVDPAEYLDRLRQLQSRDAWIRWRKISRQRGGANGLAGRRDHRLRPMRDVNGVLSIRIRPPGSPTCTSG